MEKREISTRFAAYVKVRNFNTYKMETEYQEVFGKEFDHYPSEDELFEVWDLLEESHDRLISIRVEKQVRFD